MFEKLPTSLIAYNLKKYLRLIFNEMFSFLTESNLISSNQSGFNPRAFCINQLLSITHELYKSFDQVYKSFVFFWVSQKRLIKCGTRVLSSN